MKIAARLKRLETVRAVEGNDRPLKVEFAYLKLQPREYEGPRHTVKVGQRPDNCGCRHRQNISLADTMRNRGLPLNWVFQEANAGLPGMNGLAENPVKVLRN